jgi:hypothetical protein
MSQTAKSRAKNVKVQIFGCCYHYEAHLGNITCAKCNKVFAHWLSLKSTWQVFAAKRATTLLSPMPNSIGTSATQNMGRICYLNRKKHIYQHNAK